MIVLGIDPGCGHTGWAVIRGGRTALLDCGTIKDDHESTLTKLKALAAKHEAELIAVQSPVFRNGRTPRFHRGDRSGVGLAKNSELSGLIAGLFRGLEYRVVTVAPSRRTGLKMPRLEWESYWEHAGRTSQDARDAAQIALQAYMEGAK